MLIEIFQESQEPIYYSMGQNFCQPCGGGCAAEFSVIRPRYGS